MHKFQLSSKYQCDHVCQKSVLKFKQCTALDSSRLSIMWMPNISFTPFISVLIAAKLLEHTQLHCKTLFDIIPNVISTDYLLCRNFYGYIYTATCRYTYIEARHLHGSAYCLHVGLIPSFSVFHACLDKAKAW